MGDDVHVKCVGQAEMTEDCQGVMMTGRGANAFLTVGVFFHQNKTGLAMAGSYLVPRASDTRIVPVASFSNRLDIISRSIMLIPLAHPAHSYALSSRARASHASHIWPV